MDIKAEDIRFQFLRLIKILEMVKNEPGTVVTVLTGTHGDKNGNSGFSKYINIMPGEGKLLGSEIIEKYTVISGLEPSF